MVVVLELPCANSSSSPVAVGPIISCMGDLTAPTTTAAVVVVVVVVLPFSIITKQGGAERSTSSTA